MDLSSAEIVLYSILGFVLAENLLEIYISLRQVKVYKKNVNVPKRLQDVMTEETFHKARLYGLDREQFAIIKSIITDVIILSIELYCGIIAFYWETSQSLAECLKLDSDNEIIVSCVFVVFITLVSLVKDMPFKVYSTFVLEEKHGFNKQTPKFFIIDQLKGLLVSVVLMIPITSAIVYIVQIGGEHFFIWLWLFTGAVSMILLIIYPIFIAPLFDKYTPLEEGSLRKSIEDLASRLKFPLTQLYVVEGSKRSAHSNAYFYGLWKSKRIVLFDTLLLNKGKKDLKDLKEEERGKGCTDEEILAVLGHELGHWKLGHVTYNIIIMQVQLFLMFTAFGYLFTYGPFYEAVGFPPGDQPILVGLMVVFTYVLAPYNAIIGFGMTILSRLFEYQADAFAANLGFSEQLERALIKLNLDNLGFPIYDWLYSSWNHSHPTLLQRLERLKQIRDDDKRK